MRSQTQHRVPRGAGVVCSLDGDDVHVFVAADPSLADPSRAPSLAPPLQARCLPPLQVQSAPKSNPTAAWNQNPSQNQKESTPKPLSIGLKIEGDGLQQTCWNNTAMLMEAAPDRGHHWIQDLREKMRVDAGRCNRGSDTANGQANERKGKTKALFTSKKFCKILIVYFRLYLINIVQL